MGKRVSERATRGGEGQNTAVSGTAFTWCAWESPRSQCGQGGFVLLALACSAARRLGESAPRWPAGPPAQWQRPRMWICVRPRDPSTKPSRGWLRVVVKKPRLVLAEFSETRNKVTATPRSCCFRAAGGVNRYCFVRRAPLRDTPAVHSPGELVAISQQNRRHKNKDRHKKTKTKKQKQNEGPTPNSAQRTEAQNRRSRRKTEAVVNKIG